MFMILGILSGLVFIVGDIPYILDTLKGKTKPHRVSWLIFFILDLIYLANQYALGARSTLWLVMAWTLVTFTIFSLSIKRGVGGFAKLDIASAAGAAIGLILWWLLKSPLASLYCNILVSLMAYIPVWKKAYLSPHTETRLSWFTAFLAATLAAISVGHLDFAVLVLPLYSVALTLSVFLILSTRIKQTDK